MACSAKTPDAAAANTAQTAAGSAGAPRSAAQSSAAANAGEHLYNGNCVPCHQQSGQGIPGVYPSLTGSPVLLGDPKALTLWVVKGKRPASMPEGRYSTTMLKFGWLKAADAAALFSYLRSNFGNSAPPVDPAVVAEALGQQP